MRFVISFSRLLGVFERFALNPQREVLNSVNMPCVSALGGTERFRAEELYKKDLRDQIGRASLESP
jgi:hypothetical protein